MLEKQLKLQHEAYTKFKELRVGALFMKMGTGKTKVAIDLVNYNSVDFLLYFAPLSANLNNNIINEFHKWNLSVPFMFVGYESIASSSTIYAKVLSLFDQYKNVFIIADESIFIKNEETNRFKRLVNIRKKCAYALILNGTPLTKNEWDIYNQMYFLSPLIINMSRIEFLNTFFTHIKYKKKGHYEKSFYKFSEINASELYKMIEPYIFKCDLLLDVSESSNINWIYSDFESYNNYKIKQLAEMNYNYNSSSLINLFTQLNVLAATNTCKCKAVADFSAGRRVIVFCNFLKEVDIIRDYLDNYCYVITGSEPNTERTSILNSFRDDTKPLLLTFGVGSYSLNLQFCNEIVISSISFDFGKVEQSLARIKRLGQTNDIIYNYFLCDVGINKLMLDNLSMKENLSSLINLKISEGGFEWLKSI